MNRRFSQRQRSILALVAGGNCTACGTRTLHKNAFAMPVEERCETCGTRGRIVQSALLVNGQCRPTPASLLAFAGGSRWLGGCCSQ